MYMYIHVLKKNLARQEAADASERRPLHLAVLRRHVDCARVSAVPRFLSLSLSLYLSPSRARALFPPPSLPLSLSPFLSFSLSLSLTLSPFLSLGTRRRTETASGKTTVKVRGCFALTAVERMWHL